MGQAQATYNRVGIMRDENVTYNQKSMLWGLLKWRREVKREHIADDIVIEANEPIRRIFLNGNVIYQPPNNINK